MRPRQRELTGTRKVTTVALVIVGCRGALAQLVEHLTFNQVVAGSNPARPTIYPAQHVQPGPIEGLFCA